MRLLREQDYAVASALDPYYVVPVGQTAEWSRDLAEALRLKSQAKWEKWARAHGGVHGSPQFVRIELRAVTDEPVIIHGLRVRVVRRSRALRGVFAASAMCGYESVRMASVDLDSTPPVIEYAANDESEWQRHLTLSVTRTDVEVIELQVGTSGYAEWYFEVLYSGPSGTGRITVDDHGTPFRVSSEIGSTAYHWGADGLQRWPDWDSGIKVC